MSLIIEYGPIWVHEHYINITNTLSNGYILKWLDMHIFLRL